MNENKIEQIARACHEANRIYCVSIGDHSQTSWDDAPEWQQVSARKGVVFHLDNPEATPEDSHNSWLKEKLTSGWVYGEVKDPVNKVHPCITGYLNLPKAQQEKDSIFIVTIHNWLDNNETTIDLSHVDENIEVEFDPNATSGKLTADNVIGVSKKKAMINERHKTPPEQVGEKRAASQEKKAEAKTEKLDSQKEAFRAKAKTKASLNAE